MLELGPGSVRTLGVNTDGVVLGGRKRRETPEKDSWSRVGWIWAQEEMTRQPPHRPLPSTL